MCPRPDPPSPPLGIAAVLLFSTDPAALAAFYREHLGLPLVTVDVPGLEPHWGCDVGQVYFSIWRAAEGAERQASGAASGVAFHVRSVPRELERLRAQGVAVELEPRRSPLGIVARLRDPQGNLFELYQTV